MDIEIVQVDAFADTPFSGNPAAVCVLPVPVEAGWMQNVAREMNLSETAFLHRTEDGFGLRWFTPAVEVDLCGHATLAGAHVLWESGRLGPEERAVFSTRSGRLTAEKKDGWIVLDFPSTPVREARPPEGLAGALGLTPVFAGTNGFDWLVEVDSEDTVGGMAPDFTALGSMALRGVIVTAVAESKPYDFVSRFFAPAVGVPEDPVTGSAHCALAPFWTARLGSPDLVGYQASARGGIVRVRVEGDRVHIGGKAVTVMQATLIGI